MTAVPATPLVLYAEDDENDVFLIQRAATKAGLPAKLHMVPDGSAAVEYLEKAGATPATPRPALILLDLNMPRLSGLEVLAWIRRQPALTGIPVVIFTSSNHEGDQNEARRLGVDAYVVKPSTPHECIAFVRSLIRFLA